MEEMQQIEAEARQAEATLHEAEKKAARKAKKREEKRSQSRKDNSVAPVGEDEGVVPAPDGVDAKKTKKKKGKKKKKKGVPAHSAAGEEGFDTHEVRDLSKDMPNAGVPD